MPGVEWEVKVDAPVEKVRTADAVLERMERHLSRIDAWSQAVAGHVGKLGEESKHAGHEAHSLFGEILSAEFAKDALEHLVEKVRELGKEIVMAAAEEQRMQRVFAAASGSEELGRQNEEWADILSAQTEFNEAQTEGAFIDLKRVGATDYQAKLAMKAAADIAAVSKNKDAAFSATIEAFEKIQRTGVVTNRSLAPLGLGIKDFKALDSMKGKSDKQIAALLEGGKVDRNDLFKLIMAHTGEKAIGERAASNADLLGTKLLKLQELPDKFFKKLADGKGIEKLSSAISGVLEKLDPDSPSGKRISEFLEGTFDKVAEVIDGIDIGAKIELLTEAFEGLEDIAKPILKFIGAEIEGWAFVIAKLTGHAEEFEKRRGKQAADERLYEDTKRGKKMMEAPGAEEDFADLDRAAASGALGKHSQDIYEAGRKNGKAHTDGYVAGVQEGKADVERTSSEVMGAGVEAARKRLKVHSPSEVYADLGEMSGEGYVRGWDRRSGRIDDAVMSALAAPGAGGGGAGAGQVVFAPQVTIHVDGGGASGQEAGRQAAAAFEQKVREMFFQWLDQMRQQQGAA